MIKALNLLFLNRSFFFNISVSGVLVLLLALIDHNTGFEISFSIFYLVPVSIVSWYQNKSAGIYIALLSSCAWYIVDSSSGHVYTSNIIPIWNAAVRLGFFVWTVFLLSTLKVRLKNEEKLARTDHLTGIMNASAFKESTNIYFDLAKRHNQAVTLGYIDLDNFKSVNDRHGHSEGDRVLKKVAMELKESIRSVDLVSRLGGDEFAVLLQDTDLNGAKIVFGKLRERLQEVVERERWPVGFSMGIAAFTRIPDVVDNAVKAADALMYRVKSSGKNGIVFQTIDNTE